MSYKLKPCFSSYFIFIIIAMVCSSFFAVPVSLIINIFREGFADQYILFIWLPGILVTVVYLSYYQVVIDNNVLLIPNSLFDHRKTRVDINDLKKLSVQIGVGNKKKKSFYTLWVKYKDGKAQINTKTFSIKGLEDFMKILYNNNSLIEIDKYCQSMYEGKFKEAVTKGFFTYITPGNKNEETTQNH